MASKPTNSATAKRTKSGLEKKTASFSRWLHIYLSMISFVVVLFFSATGLTLNHAEWFEGKEVEQKYKGQVPTAWVNSIDTAEIKKLEIVELMRKSYGIKGYVSDFLIQDDEISISFKGPGYRADSFVDRKTGDFELTELKMGLGAVMNDLHKGRDSGKGWGWLIDVSAVFLVIVSLSGLVMLLFLKKKKVSGLLIAVLGGVICWLIYYLLVP